MQCGEPASEPENEPGIGPAVFQRIFRLMIDFGQSPGSSLVRFSAALILAFLSFGVSSGLGQTPTPAPSPIPSATPAYPLKASANRRYLVDQNNVPFLMTGHDAQGLIGVLSHADADFFFANRKAAGFNSFWIDLLCYRCTTDATGETTDGIPPFTTHNDISTPNEVYFARVDDRLRLAEQYGLNVVLDPAETAGSLQLLRSNGVAKNRAYGQYLGNRYRDFNNIIWMSGNDFQTWSDPTDAAVVQAVALGIMDTDTRHLQTVELNYWSSDSLTDPSWAPIISLNAAYTYYPTYYQVLIAYNRSNFVPVFMVEANYEFGHNGADTGTPDVLRKQEYWASLSGANAGQQYGNRHMSGYSSFESGWQNWLDTPGAAQMGYWRWFFESRRWYDLIPDQNHEVVTAVAGGFDCDETDTIRQSNCTTAARTLDGALALAYVPINATVTANLAQLGDQITARWFDPTNNSYRPIPGSPFPNSGSVQFAHPGINNGGFNDWILVLESGAVPATIYITGNVPSCTHSVSSPVPDVMLTVTGSVSSSAMSDNAGNYRLDGLPSSGNYTVTPNKSGVTPTTSNINTFDAIAIMRHFLSLRLLEIGCPSQAADVNGDTAINTLDALAIQRFYLGRTGNLASVGHYKFNPSSRTYAAASGNQANQNYDALIVGDVVSGF